MQQIALKYYTPEEYLALEDEADYKSEYYQGEIFAMAGASSNHSRITRNLITKLTNAFEGRPCEAFSNELKIWVDAVQLFTYPHIIVVCNKLDYYKDRRVPSPIHCLFSKSFPSQRKIMIAAKSSDSTERFQLCGNTS